MLKECATAEVRGLVLNAETRAPIDQAKVAGDNLGATTGPDGRFTITNIHMRANNTPWQLKLTASADGFVSQTRTVNVFCGARIDVGFGSLPAAPAVLVGTVTDRTSGAPLGDVFVGTGFGGGVRTAADGRTASRACRPTTTARPWRGTSASCPTSTTPTCRPPSRCPRCRAPR